MTTPKMAAAAADTIRALSATKGARQAVKYLSTNDTVKATYLHKPHGRDRQVVYLVTVGRPNFLERRFIKAAKKAGEPFPVKKVQFRYFPKTK